MRANVNAVDGQGRTPLHLYFVAGCSHIRIAQLLLDRGANVNAVDRQGQTPLSIAARDGRIVTARTLIKYIMLHNCNITKPDYIVNNRELSRFWDFYRNRMVNTRFSNSTISLYQFLRETNENKLAGYLSDKSYDGKRYFEAMRYAEVFPKYASMITGQFNKALRRRGLLDTSNIVMNKSDDLQKLSEIPRDQITNCLTNEELKNIIRAPFSVPSQNLDNPHAEQLQAPAQARD